MQKNPRIESLANQKEKRRESKDCLCLLSYSWAWDSETGKWGSRKSRICSEIRVAGSNLFLSIINGRMCRWWTFLCKSNYPLHATTAFPNIISGQQPSLDHSSSFHSCSSEDSLCQWIACEPVLIWSLGRVKVIRVSVPGILIINHPWRDKIMNSKGFFF